MSQPDALTRGSRISEHTDNSKEPSRVFARACVACLTSFVVAVHYTNFSQLITAIKADLHTALSGAGDRLYPLWPTRRSLCVKTNPGGFGRSADTFGLGNAIAAWITIYLINQFGLSLTVAATTGSLALISGVIFRPLGGILLARRLIGAIALPRVGTIMGFKSNIWHIRITYYMQIHAVDTQGVYMHY